MERQPIGIGTGIGIGRSGYIVALAASLFLTLATVGDSLSHAYPGVEGRVKPVVALAAVSSFEALPPIFRGQLPVTIQPAAAVAPGQLTVTIQPAAAVAAGALWRVGGSVWRKSGTSVTLPYGWYVVTFKSIAGWTTPPSVFVIIQGHTWVTRTYTRPTGQLTVTIQPEAAVAAGAQWQVDGGAWHNSGETVTLAVGQHPVSFNSISGWTSPPPQNVTITQRRTTSVTGTYTSKFGQLPVTIQPAAAVAPGQLTVTIQPPAAIVAGAAWRVDGGVWRKSGTTVTLPAGWHIVTFKSIPGWISPPSAFVNITQGQTTSVTRTYTQPPGQLTVTIQPAAAVAAGAQWQVDGGAWHNSGETVTLAVGQHPVSFNSISGWNSPLSQNVTITQGQTTSATGTYTQGPPTVTLPGPTDNYSAYGGPGTMHRAVFVRYTDNGAAATALTLDVSYDSAVLTPSTVQPTVDNGCALPPSKTVQGSFPSPGVYRIVISGGTAPVTDGVIAIVYFDVSDSAPNGQLSALSATGSYSTAPSTPLSLPSAQGAFVVGGDLNDNLEVDVGDVQKVITILLLLDPDQPCGDLNHNGSTDIGDVQRVINLILEVNPTCSAQAPELRMGAPSVVAPLFTIGTTCAVPGTTGQALPVTFGASGAQVSAFSLTITCPASAMTITGAGAGADLPAGKQVQWSTPEPGQLQIVVSGGTDLLPDGQLVEIDFDVPQAAQAGKYAVTGTAQVSDPDGNPSTAGVTSGCLSVAVPLLSSGYVIPSTGTNSTLFTWRVKYWNTENAAPNEVKVAIWFPTLKTTYWYTMWAYDPADTNCKDGKWYTFSRKWLPAGTYAYRFAARQGSNWAYWPAPAGTYASGPTVNP